ncbi:MAG: VWA domain-containing protein [Acidimicrobiales bacterium]|nr:VWA domain-containing protein [Acidimicrobiales bacterium]
MLDLLTGFVAELRAAGIPVSLTEHLDAAEALRHVPMEDREAIKYTLGASLVKSSSHWRAYETAFEIYFSLRGPDYRIDDEVDSSGEPADDEGRLNGAGDRRGQGRGGGTGAGEGMTPEELADLLYKALLSANDAMVSAVARQAVTRYAGMEAGRPVGGTYYLYRTLRNLDLERVLDRLLDQARAATSTLNRRAKQDPEAPETTLTALEERLLRDEYQARIDQLRKEIEDEIRRRLVADRGSEALAKSLRKPLPEDIDVMHATREELVALRKSLQPLSRKLAVRLARKRRHGRKGPLDFRSTVRHSLSTGGVPVDPKFRYPRPSKPEIVVIADISGSVASFARFTLHLVHAISSQFSKVRSFVFIDGIDEVSRFFEGSDDPSDAVHRINTEADVIWVDGHSDYGHALTVFWERWGEEITPRSSVLLLGDARNNYHASQAWVVKELQGRARHVYWLNPEPRAYWNSGDSIVGEYAIHCDEVVECRTLRQLEQFVGELA